jgi:hypothetical protein
MTKKYILFISLGILFIISSIFFVLKKHQPIIDNLFKAVPADAAFIIDVKNYSKFRSELDANNKIWQELSQISIFSGVNEHIHLIDSLQKNNGFLKGFIANNPAMLISGHFTGKSTIELLYCIQMHSKSNFQQIHNILRKIPGSAISEHRYNGKKISEILIPSKKENISFCYLNGVLLLSKSSMLIENALRNLVAPDQIADQKGLDELIKSAGKSTAINFYLNYSALPGIGAKIFHPKFGKSLEFLSYFGDWAEFDLNVKSDIIIFNGFSSSQKPQESLHSIFANQKPQKLEMFGKIPVNANTFAVMAISNLEQYFKATQQFIAKKRIIPSDTNVEFIRKTFNINLLEDFKKIFDNEVGAVIVDSPTDTLQQIFTLIRVKNNEIAEQTLNNWIEGISSSNGTNVKEAIQEIVFENDLSGKLFRLSNANIPMALFGSLYKAEGNEYCALSDNYMIFGSSPKALKTYIQQILTNNTLNTNIEFNEFSEYFSTQTNFFFYNKPSLSTRIFDTYLKQNLAAEFKNQPYQLSNMQALVFQFSTNNQGSIYNNIFIKYAKAIIDNTPKTTWESQLEGNCILKPTMVKNYMTRETEIITQDDKFNVYLLNKLGRILWKINVGEPILSDIYQIDYHKNRKLQYLFNTAGKIFIIDRNGKSLEKFPVELKEKATNGMAVFDYDKNRDYRIFLACADKKVYLFDINGKQSSSWKAKEIEGIVKNPIQHFRFNAADYITFNDEKSIYIANRKGRQRVKPDRQFAVSPNNKVALATNRKTKKSWFAISDTTGLIYLIDTKGKTTTLDVGRYSAAHFFDVVDLDADGTSEFMIASGKNIQIFSQKAEKIMQIVTDYPVSHHPLFYEFSTNHFKIGVVTNENDKIYLYNPKGELHQGFPLKGNSQFSIGLLNNSENRFNLIVGSNRNLLYNYSVQ